MAQTDDDGLRYLGPIRTCRVMLGSSTVTRTRKTTPRWQNDRRNRNMATEETEQRTTSEQRREDNRSLFVKFAEEYAEEELAIILIAAGVVMMVIPPFQPVGIASIFLGLAVWFSDWLWG